MVYQRGGFILACLTYNRITITTTHQWKKIQRFLSGVINRVLTEDWCRYEHYFGNKVTNAECNSLSMAGVTSTMMSDGKMRIAMGISILIGAFRASSSAR
jgi:hypothetical protein